MQTVARWTLRLLLAGALVAPPAQGAGDSATPVSRPELEYLKAVNRAAPPQDPQLLFLLMGQYASANLHGEGAEFITALLEEFAPRLSGTQKSLYLSAIGVLRAGHAGNVGLLGRVGWIRDTIDLLEQARRLSGNESFVVRWSSGVVYAQLPGVFGRREMSLADLHWCLDNAANAPHLGWLREIYYQLARLANENGEEAQAKEYLQQSGYPAFGKPVTLTTPNSVEPEAGHAFSPRRIAEIVPGRVFALSGYEFTEYYFIVSDDGRELVGIDAGTRPDSARTAYEALRAYAPRLPALTTVLVTHSHWDHIGGHRYFESLSPRPKFYARANYHDELSRSAAAPDLFAKRFFGARFRLEDVKSFRPDTTVEHSTELRIGGTRVEFIPVQGGETDDALFIHLPELGVLFVGDFIMPYLGAPFVEEGSLDGLLAAIDIARQKTPRYILHGHEPLTRLFPSVSVLAAIQSDLDWLRGEVVAAIERGTERSAIHRANLVPPGLLTGDPGAHLPYLVMRENVINRLYDQKVGYWQPDLQGLDALSRADRGALLVDYLGVSERQLGRAVERMLADGRYELAASTLDWTRSRFPESTPLRESERLAYLKLMEKYQEFNPFKFIIYSGKGGMQVPQMAPPVPAAGGAR